MTGAYLLSESDVKLLRAMARKIGLTNNSDNAYFEARDDVQTPDVYVAKIPDDGIPARVGAIPGYIDGVPIYRVLGDGADAPQLVGLEFNKRVYNLSITEIPGSTGTGTGSFEEETFVLVLRDKFGQWFIPPPPEPITQGNNVYQPGSGRVLGWDFAVTSSAAVITDSSANPVIIFITEAGRYRIWSTCGAYVQTSGGSGYLYASLVSDQSDSDSNAGSTGTVARTTGTGATNAEYCNQTLIADLRYEENLIISTTVAADIPAGVRTVTPGSMFRIDIGSYLLVDSEVVLVTAKTATTFTATFATDHFNPVPIAVSPTIQLKVYIITSGGQVYSSAFIAESSLVGIWWHRVSAP